MDDGNDRGWMERFVLVSTKDIVPAIAPPFPESWNLKRKFLAFCIYFLSLLQILPYHSLLLGILRGGTFAGDRGDSAGLPSSKDTLHYPFGLLEIS